MFFDSNVLIDLFGDTGDQRGWSQAVYARAARGEPVVSNPIVVAEVAAGFDDEGNVVRDIENLSIEIADLQVDTALRGARAFREYRKRGGSRERILPDFLIAAHAETLGAALVTRDRRLASYFPDLTFITPETHPHG